MMNIETLTAFFMWCIIINGSIYLLWVLFFLLAPEFVCRVQTRWILVLRETYNAIILEPVGLRCATAKRWESERVF
jgi:hypothetical protein